MAKPPIVITSALPADRLNQIATGKLTALAVVVRLDADGQTLKGELSFKLGKILHVATRAPIGHSAFVVVGHDHLHFTNASLGGLGPVMFFDLPNLGALEERIAALLQRRMASVLVLAEKLKKLRINSRIDPDQLQVVGEIKAVPHSFELRGGPEGIWVSRIISADGTSKDLPAQAAVFGLDQFQSQIDLEMYLTDALPTLLGKKREDAAHVATAPPAAVLENAAADPAAITLAMLAQRLGPDAVFGLGNPSEVTQDFTVGKVAYRFSAVHVSGPTFKGKLVGPKGEKWSDKFDLMRFPGISRVVASVLGIKPHQAATGPAANLSPAGPVVASHLVPQENEVWVMNVIIEREDQGEVRYACTNVDGKPFGATRLLKSNEFREVFVQSGSGWRLLILIEAVGGDASVAYRQLDSQRKPRGTQKRIPIAILVTNFVPEATAY